MVEALVRQTHTSVSEEEAKWPPYTGLLGGDRMVSGPRVTRGYGSAPSSAFR